MAARLYRQLLRQASRLARLDPTRPQQASLRRAISTGYYSYFHFLVDASSRFLVGTSGHREGLRKATTRAYSHTAMAAVARSFSGGSMPGAITASLGPVNIPAALSRLSRRFLVAQEQRHRADYDLSATFVRSEVITLINGIEQAIEDWATIRKEPAAELFLIGLLVWDRLRSR